MAFIVGPITQVSVTSVGDVLTSAAAASGTTPYSYQWYRSTTSGFTPGTGNIISGATTVALTDSGLTPGTKYYYKIVATDSAGTPILATSAQLLVTTLAPTVSQNQFTEAPFLGMTDLRLNYNTLEVQFDPAGSGTLVGGQAVKWSTVAGGAPMVVPSTATSDVLAGWVNYDIKTAVYNPGDRLQISMGGNVIYLYAALAISRGNLVTSLPAAVAGGCNGGVVPATGSSGLPIAGTALDTVVIGSLVRIELQSVKTLDS